MVPLLSIQNLRKEFGGLTAVSDVSFTVNEGEIVALLGPNGSGKTTVLNMISGALTPTSGTILLAGDPISNLPPYKIAHKGVARTFQLVKILPSLTVQENIIAALAFRQNPLWGASATETANQLLTQVGLDNRGHEQAQDLTYIDQKRMELARAIALNPKVLLLDEWLSGLNPTELSVGIDLILSLKDKGMTILLVEHIMDAVRALCTRSVVMNVGHKIADGPTAQVLAEPAVITAYLGEGHA